MDRKNHRIFADGMIFEHRRHGRADLHVSRDGLILAVTGNGGRRPPDTNDIERLQRSGRIGILPAAARSGAAPTDVPLRRVHVIKEAATGVSPRVGPTSPAEIAEDMAIELAVQSAVHASLSVRGAYMLYCAAISDLNEGLGRHPVFPMSPADFGRQAAVAAFIVDAHSRKPNGRGPTRH